jgi:2,3-diaminopropionate biosynthesis protein SbnA
MTRYLDFVGRTPLVRLPIAALPRVELYAKLELANPTGSVKDRAAKYIIEGLLARGVIDRETVLIESSSGNFGIALAARARLHGLRFICVVDPMIARPNLRLLQALGAEIVQVTEPDAFGGYLKTRLKRVHELRKSFSKAYWIDQYGNPLNASAYSDTLAVELCDALPRIDYLFAGVSSGGTITGISWRIKERFPAAQVIAVDMEGSVIFGRPSRKRYIPGIGSSIVPPILAQAKIDDVVIVDEAETIAGCHELLREHGVFAGGSSGSSIAAIRKYFLARPRVERAVVATLLPDRGDRYVDTIYDPAWSARFVGSDALDTIPTDGGQAHAVSR